MFNVDGIDGQFCRTCVSDVRVCAYEFRLRNPDVVSLRNGLVAGGSLQLRGRGGGGKGCLARSWWEEGTSPK